MKKILLIFCAISFNLTATPLSWERPVIIGASLSDGFHLRGRGFPMASRKSRGLGLHHHLKASMTANHGPIRNLGSNYFFLAAQPNGIYQMKKAKAAKATVIFAIDYLFWYLSSDSKHRGRGFRDLTRLEFFEKGLANLATFDCPIVVGNIPDAASSVGRVLSKAQYPGTETVKKANARLKEWLKDHSNIALMDLHKFHRLASTDQEMEVAGQTIPEGKSRELYLQWDQIHPTPTGASAIAKVALEALEKHTSEAGVDSK